MSSAGEGKIYYPTRCIQMIWAWTKMNMRKFRRGRETVLALESSLNAVDHLLVYQSMKDRNDVQQNKSLLLFCFCC